MTKTLKIPLKWLGGFSYFALVLSTAAVSAEPRKPIAECRTPEVAGLSYGLQFFDPEYTELLLTSSDGRIIARDRSVIAAGWYSLAVEDYFYGKLLSFDLKSGRLSGVEGGDLYDFVCKLYGP